MILEFLPHRACDHILPTLLSVSFLDLLCHVHLLSAYESLGLPPVASCPVCPHILYHAKLMPGFFVSVMGLPLPALQL